MTHAPLPYYEETRAAEWDVAPEIVNTRVPVPSYPQFLYHRDAMSHGAVVHADLYGYDLADYFAFPAMTTRRSVTVLVFATDQMLSTRSLSDLFDDVFSYSPQHQPAVRRARAVVRARGRWAPAHSLFDDED
jgi:hypothetical protein